MGKIASYLLAVAFVLFAGCEKSGQGVTPPIEPSKTTFRQCYNPGMTFYSQKLQQQVRYTLLLPQEYLTMPAATFDVVYMFHGFGDSDEFFHAGRGMDVQRIDAEVRAEGYVRPLIYVMPNGGNSYFVNRYDGLYPYMDMIVSELVPLIDRMLRTNAKPESRAVAGMSMGGFGALAVGSLNPEVFGMVIALSPSLNTDEQYKYLGAWDSQWGSVFGGVGSIGDARITSHYKANCPLHFFASNPEKYRNISYFLDCGDDEERLYLGSGELHSVMRNSGIAHEYRVRNGAHTSEYWRTGIKEGLRVFESKIAGIRYPEYYEPEMPELPEFQSTAICSGRATLFSGVVKPAGDAAHMIYVEVLSGSGQPDAETVARGLSPLLKTYNAAIALFSPSSFPGMDAEDIIAEINAEVGINPSEKQRQCVVYGKGESLLARYAFSGAALGGFYAVDPGWEMPEDAKFNSRIYMLTAPDMGANHEETIALFDGLRQNDAPCQYRVVNGPDSKTGTALCLNQMWRYMNIPVR